MSDPKMTSISTEAVEEALRLAEIGEYLFDKAYAHGDGHQEPREFGIEWHWQQSKPDEYGQGALLAEAAAWHDEMVADEMPTEAAKLRSFLSALLASHEARGKALEEIERTIKRRQRQAETTRKFYLRDAKEALAGDMRALRNRVALMEAGPVEVVLSESQALGGSNHG